MSEHISVRKDGHVLRLGFNRPEKKNAITAPMYAALARGLAEAARDDAVRVVLFEGAGDFYTAGNDIADFLAGAATTPDEEGSVPVVRFLQAIATAEKPMVAAVQGPAVGVGVTMLLHCDLVYASETATFHAPFVDLALVPEAASSLLLPRLAGYQRAAEMFMLGARINAERAREFGFVNAVVAPDALEETAMNAARALSEKAPAALRLTRRLMKGERSDILARMTEEGEHFDAQLGSPEFREVGTAFMEKRKPDFSKAG